MRYTRQLEFAVRPDYDYLRGLFRRVQERMGYSNDAIFDWSNCKIVSPAAAQIKTADARDARATSSAMSNPRTRVRCAPHAVRAPRGI